MNIFFMDSETTGLPKNYSGSYTDLDNWPRVMSLAWSVADHLGNVVVEEYRMIKPNGWVVPKEKFWIDNGYSTERSMREGVDMNDVMDLFMTDIAHGDVLVAHNLSFDHPIVWAEVIRSGRQVKSGMHKICTMKSAVAHANILGKNGRAKWPKLDELYRFLFRKDFEGAHNALADVVACREIFFELLKRGVIQLPVAA